MSGTAMKLANLSALSLPSFLPSFRISVYACVCLYVYVYGSIVEPSGFRVLGLVVALGVPFNKQHLLSIDVLQ